MISKLEKFKEILVSYIKDDEISNEKFLYKSSPQITILISIALVAFLVPYSFFQYVSKK